MGALKIESKLFEELSKQFENHKDEITLNVYKDAIDIARKYDKEEIQFVLFKLRYVNGDIETGVDAVNMCFNIGRNILNVLTRKQYKLAFIYSVLEAA